MNEVEDGDFVEPQGLNFPSNSNRPRLEKKEEEVSLPDKKIQQIVTGKVIKKKTSLVNRFAHTFFGDDAQSVGTYVFMDVLIPAAKNMILDMLTMGGERLLYGEGRRNTRRDRDRTPRVSYNRFSEKEETRRDSPRNKARYDFEDIAIPSRLEADEVLERMTELVDNYGQATVADFYELVGVIGDFTDNKYGWTNLNRSTVRRVREGYIVDLPRPYELE